MHLTGNELTAASSAVAAVAIAGGYLGVRSANRNALKIAREERSSRRKDELDALKRTVYVQCLAEFMALAAASVEVSNPQSSGRPRPLKPTSSMAALKQALDATQVAYRTVSDLDLIAPNPVRELAAEAAAAAANCAHQDVLAFTRVGAKLRMAMRYDLRGIDIPSPDELDRLADLALAYMSPKSEADNQPT